MIHLVEVGSLTHIEGFSAKRARFLADKIDREGIWTKPVVIDSPNRLVMDGQHRMEAATLLGLPCIPAVSFQYTEVRVWSLRPQYQFDYQVVIQRALANNPFPYKTVKHEFPVSIPSCHWPIAELRECHHDV